MIVLKLFMFMMIQMMVQVVVSVIQIYVILCVMLKVWGRILFSVLNFLDLKNCMLLIFMIGRKIMVMMMIFSLLNQFRNVCQKLMFMGRLFRLGKVVVLVVVMFDIVLKQVLVKLVLGVLIMKGIVFVVGSIVQIEVVSKNVCFIVICCCILCVVSVISLFVSIVRIEVFRKFF